MDSYSFALFGQAGASNERDFVLKHVRSESLEEAAEKFVWNCCPKWNAHDTLKCDAVSCFVCLAVTVVAIFKSAFPGIQVSRSLRQQ